MIEGELRDRIDELEDEIEELQDQLNECQSLKYLVMKHLWIF